MSVAQAHYYRGRALFESRRDRAGGRRVVDQARVLQTAIDSEMGRRLVAETDRWLLANPLR